LIFPQTIHATNKNKDEEPVIQIASVLPISDTLMRTKKRRQSQQVAIPYSDFQIHAMDTYYYGSQSDMHKQHA